MKEELGIVEEKIGKKEKELKKKEVQKKYFLDYAKDSKGHSLVRKLLQQANSKDHGREITLKDLVDQALTKLNSKDIEKVQENSLESRDKLMMFYLKNKEKGGSDIGFEEFLVKQLKI